ncbi:MAG: hypothetical protein GQF41_4426 [Candidatus Rifleibacterium amylolyticum]|nr:MAG: hypothetical protein GQF41_4426 [Candidatus Rifleibacterium amylolyticum]
MPDPVSDCGFRNLEQIGRLSGVYQLHGSSLAIFGSNDKPILFLRRITVAALYAI